MKRLGVVVVVVLLLAASGAPDAETLMRRGDRAVENGQWAEALRYYEMAELWAEEPQQVAFNLATVRYRLAENGELRELAGAEEGYRACLEGPRRGRALLGLGNCLMLRAVGPGRADPVLLRAAIDRFSEALESEDVDASRVRHNRERARLLLLQAEQPSGDDQQAGDEPPEPGPKENGETTEEKKEPERVPTQKDGTEQEIDEPRDGVAGKGKLPPVPELASVPPIGEGDAAQHLEAAARRIVEEWRQYRRSQSRPILPGKDW